jgi:hypothetical protein
MAGTTESSEPSPSAAKRMGGVLRGLAKSPASSKGHGLSPTSVGDGASDNEVLSDNASSDVYSAIPDESQKPKSPISKTGTKGTNMKDQVLTKYPALAIEQFSSGAHARNFILCGANSLRAEALDMLVMVFHMEEKMMKLTHAAVDRFFEWIPILGVYIERYMFAEEDVLVEWISEKEGQLKGTMRESNRILMRGKVQKALTDLFDMQDIFLHSLPAGERIGRVVTAADAFANLVIEYVDSILVELPMIIDKHYKKAAIEKEKQNWAKYILSHVGSEDFLVLYTRWMNSGDLREWKMKVLMRVEFKYLAYTSWERNMNFAHFRIASDFEKMMEDEEDEDAATREMQHEQFLLNKSAARKHQQRTAPSSADCDERSLTEDGDRSDDEGSEEQNAFTVEQSFNDETT